MNNNLSLYPTPNDIKILQESANNLNPSVLMNLTKVQTIYGIQYDNIENTQFAKRRL